MLPVSRRTFLSGMAACLAAPAAQAQQQGRHGKFQALAQRARGHRLVLGIHATEGHAEVIRQFQKEFPEIRVQYSEMSMNALSSRISTEQRNGLFLWDVVWGATQSLNTVLLPAGGLEPIAPYIELPEISDERQWWAPRAYLYSDPHKPYIFLHNMQMDGAVLVNRKRLDDIAIASIDDLLDPRLRGRVSVADPTFAGNGLYAAAALYREKGPQFLKKLLIDQKALVISNSRQVTDTIIRGRAVAVVGGYANHIGRCQKFGGCLDIYRPDIKPKYVLPRGIAVVRNAPNKAATKLFVNWFLSKQGQDTFVRAWAKHNFVGASSLRRDVTPWPSHRHSIPDYAALGQYLMPGLTAYNNLLKVAKSTCEEILGV